MKIIAKPVKAIAIFDYDGTITPCKFKYKKAEHFGVFCFFVFFPFFY